MKYKIIILCYIVIINSCYSQTINFPKSNFLSSSIVECVKNDLMEDRSLCPYFVDLNQDEKWMFYEAEIKYFKLEAVFEKAKKIIAKKKYSKIDTLGIMLFYPFVGFDPLSGYQSAFFLYKKDYKKGILFNYNIDEGKFKKKKLSKKKIKERIKSYKSWTSGCGTGYFIYYFIPLSFDKGNCFCAYDIE